MKFPHDYAFKFMINGAKQSRWSCVICLLPNEVVSLVSLCFFIKLKQKWKNLYVTMNGQLFMFGFKSKSLLIFTLNMFRCCRKI